MRNFLIIISLSCLCGCSILGHLDQLLMMGEYSRDKNVQHKMVGDTNASYDALVAVINSDRMKNYSDQQAIRSNFGEPIAIKTVDVNGVSQEQWLYRHAIPQKAKDKVYLYFDKDTKLVKYTREEIEW